MSCEFPLPERISQYYYSHPTNAYGRYRFVSGDENGFLAYMVALYPNLEWVSYPRGSDWEAKHGANTMSRYERVPLGNAFHSNSKEVQLDEVYQWLRIILDGWANCAANPDSDCVVVWFEGFDIMTNLHLDSMTHRPTLQIALSVAYYQS